MACLGSRNGRKACNRRCKKTWRASSEEKTGMSRLGSPVGVLFLGPDIRSQGGIAAVIANYQRSGFWTRCRCAHFVTYRDWSGKLSRFLYSVWRCCMYIPGMLIARPAVVSVHMSVQGSFYRKFYYILMSRLLAIPVVIHIHPSAFSEFYIRGNALTKYAIRACGNLSECLVFLSESAMRSLRAVFPGVKMVVVPNPVAIDLYASTNRAPMAGNFRILFMGWIIQGKGVYDIVDVIPEVAARVPQVEFIFAGNKEVERLKKMIENRHLSRYARVLGWVQGQQKLDLLLTSRMLLLPTYSEGIPNVILEAMASGLPVITTPVGGIPSIFVEGENGYFVTPGNTRELAQRIIQMMDDDKDCENISRLTRKRAETCYAVEVIGKQLEHVYEKFVKETT